MGFVIVFHEQASQMPAYKRPPQRLEEGIFLGKNMDKTRQVLLTAEGQQELHSELEELEQVKLPEAVRRLTEAREAGDLSENSEYTAARDDLAFIEGRVAEIKDILSEAKTIKKKHGGAGGKVDVGCSVHVSVKGKNEKFFIVGEWEADPMEKKISHQSPLGKSLIGKKVGETIEVDAPAGKIAYKILKIE